MGNVFDQFDAPSGVPASSSAAADLAARGFNLDETPDLSGVMGGPGAASAGYKPPPAPKASEENPFDRFDPDYGQPKSSGMTIAEQVPVGANEALANTIGAPVDFINWGLKKAGLPMSDMPIGGSESIKKAMGVIGANPEEHPANTTAERIARAAGQGFGSVLGPEATIGLLAEKGLAAVAPQTTEALQSAFGQAKSVPGVLGNAGIGAAAGTSGQAAAEAVPDKYKPYAQLAGTLLGGSAVAGTAALTGSAIRGAQEGLGNFTRPFVGKEAPVLDASGNPIIGSAGETLTAKPGQLDIARQRLAESSASVPAVREALDTAPRELVPGSAPTTFQLTGDMGLGSLERTVAGANNEDSALFNTRRAEQNSARLAGMNAPEPFANPVDAANSVTKQLRALDDMSQTYINAAMDKATTKASNIGPGLTPEAHGAVLRDALADARSAAKVNERSLWSAVDPNGDLGLNAQAITTKAADLAASLPKTAKPMEGEEGSIFEAAQDLPQVAPFSDITALRSRISTAMAAERRAAGETPAYARLAQLRGAVEDAISNTIQGRVLQDQAAVAAGQMAPEDALGASLANEAQQFLASRSSNLRAGNAGNAGSRSVAVPSPSGAASPQGFRLPEDTQGIPEQTLSPFDQGARDRLNAATEATKQRAQTFDTGPVGKVLKRPGTTYPYDVPNSLVAKEFFKPGPEGFERVQAFRNAVPDADAKLADYAADNLAQSAIGKDGLLNPKEYATWEERHRDALRAFPDLQRQFADASTAAETVTKMAQARKAALEDFQQGTVGKLIGVSDPTTVKRTIGQIFGQRNAVPQMQRLAELTAKDPDARAGLRRAIIDHMMDNFVSNTEAATSRENLIKADAFQTFVKKNNSVLSTVFSPDEIKGFNAIAEDLKRSNRSVTAVKQAGASDTAAKLRSAEKLEAGTHEGSLLSKLWKSVVIGGEAGPHGAIAGAIGAVGTHVLGGMRAAGMRNINDLVKEALLNPDLAKTLLMRAPIAPSRGSAVSLAQQLRRISIIAALPGAKKKNKETVH